MSGYARRDAVTGIGTRRGWTLGVLAIGTVALLLRARASWAYLTDDAYISMQYASRFLHGEGLTWTSGALPVEGYSNLLWVLSLAALGAVGIDLEIAVRILGITCTWLLLALVAWRAWDRPAVAALGTAALVGSGTIATWSVAGLEAPMVALLAIASAYVAAAAAEGSASPWHAGLLLAALTLARVDGFLFAPIVAVVVSARNADVGKRIIVLPLAALLAHTGFRWLYYGDVVPNVAHVKMEASGERFESGLRYVAFAFKWSAPLLLGAAVLGAWARGTRIAILLAMGGAWTAYLVFIGGDIFAARRHWELCVAVSAFTVVEALRDVRPLWVTGVGVAAVAAFVVLQLGDGENTRADERWTQHALTLGRALQRGFAQLDPLMAVHAAGALPYGSGFRCIDMLGLNDREIALNPVPNDEPMIGHDHFNAAIVLRREPDFIVYGNGMNWRTGPVMEDLLAQPDFGNYDLIPFRTGKRTQRWVYIRRDSPRVGIVTEGDRVVIPAWFFADDDHWVRTASVGRPSIQIESGDPVSVSLPLEPGPWRGSAEADGDVLVTIEGAEVPLAAPRAATVTVEPVATDAAALYGVTLTL
jgi:arabinofuranosyltransferase